MNRINLGKGSFLVVGFPFWGKFSLKPFRQFSFVGYLARI